jgi:leader peptidase (prepilin peptidase)/N-methyltransferase
MTNALARLGAPTSPVLQHSKLVLTLAYLEADQASMATVEQSLNMVRHAGCEPTDVSKWGAAVIGALLGLLILAAAYQFGPTIRAVANLPTMTLLAIAAVLDFRRRRIPDWLTLPGISWVLAASAFLGWPRLVDALLGILVCGGALLILAVASRGSIGGGDVKLMAMIGGSLGWRWGLGVLVVAQVAAAFLAIPMLLSRRKSLKDLLPFGPFLVAFAILALLSKPM